MTSSFDWSKYEKSSESNGSPAFDWSQYESKKSLGTKGEVVGGMAGSSLEANIEDPNIFIKALPIALAKRLEALGPKGAEFIADMVSKVIGKPSRTEEQKEFLQTQQERPSLSDLLEENAIKDLPEHLRQGAKDTSDLLAMFGWLPKRGASAKTKGPSSANAPPPGEPPPIPKKPKETPQTMYEERAAFNEANPPGGGAANKEISAGIKEAGKDIKKRILGPNLSEEIPKSLSKERIRNTTQAGMDLEEAFSEIFNDLTSQENKLYAVSEKANKAKEAIHPELVESFRDYINALEDIPDKSDSLTRSLKSAKNVINRFAITDESGAVIGYKPVSNQILIEQAKQFNLIPKYDFPTETKTGIYKKFIGNINEAIEKTAVGDPEAVASWHAAKDFSARKNELFGDRDVRQWIRLADKNYSKEYRAFIDIDKMRKGTPALNISEKGRVSLQRAKAELVDKVLADHYSITGRFDKKEISKVLAELEPVFTPEELKVIEGLIEEAQTPGAEALSIGSKLYRYFKRPSQAVKDVGKIN